MHANPAHDGLQELAYELSRGALARQEEVLNELRARTGTLLAASSIVASFLGSQATQEGSGPLTILALAAFVVSVGASMYVLVPKEGLIFALRGSVLFEEEYDEPGGLPETYRRLAYWLDTYYESNHPTVRWMFRGYWIAAIAVLGQVLLWVLELAV
jgi:hypothetical protein